MFQLINAKDIQQLADLTDKVVTFINVAEFHLDEADMHGTKRLVVKSLYDYLATRDSALKLILENYYSTLSRVLA